MLKWPVEFLWHRWWVAFGFGPFVPFKNTLLLYGNPKILRVKKPRNIFTPWTVCFRFYLQLLHTKSAESCFCSSKLELFSGTFWKRWNWWVFGVWIIWRTLNSSYTPTEYFMFCGNKPTYRPTLYIHLHSTPLHPIKFHFKKRTSQRLRCSFCERSAANKDSCVRLG